MFGAGSASPMGMLEGKVAVITGAGSGVGRAMATLPRTGELGEVADLALFLASSKSSLVNGSCIVIDGGWTVL